jgi:CRP-like cAMP-binding protein
MFDNNGSLCSIQPFSRERPQPDSRGARRHVDRAIGNELLHALPAETARQFLALMERVPLNRRQVIQERNLPLRHAYFIESGAASLLARAGDRSTVEIRTVGARDFVGIPLVLGTGRSPHRCVVQVPGHAWRITAEELVRSLDNIPELRRVLLAYVQTALSHSAQLVACNTRHSLRERVARWLLIASDELRSDTIALTHDSMSRALGVRRASVTTTMAQMEQAGLIRRGRGQIMVLDRDGLEGACCGCYRAISAEHAKTLAPSAPGQLCPH